ncbi:sigma-70 family RNA polymerase sigma factor [Tissierella creatinini]|nr:sigma-70 family RNA polymerase sigma factor [Tissierella creatinini]TJX64342.1 sigma-70 family RNA polymerase sigma factor [Soehngenia saccharolytica]
MYLGNTEGAFLCGGSMYEEINILLKESRKGDSLSRERLLKSLEPLIISSIRKYCNRPNEYEDLLQEGRVLVLECLDSYDESKGTHFLGYVKHMLMYYYLDKNKKKVCLSLNEKIGNDGEEEIIDLLESNDEDVLDTLIRFELGRHVKDSILKLTDKQRKIVFDFYIKGKKIDKIAEELNISYRTVVNIKNAALGKLKKHLLKVED